MALMLDVDESLARYGSVGGQVVARCTVCMRPTIILASVMKLATCDHCAGRQTSFPVPQRSDQFRANCVNRLHARFHAAEVTTGISRPRDQKLLQWLGFTADELASHVSEMLARGCYYCGREIFHVFHIAHVDPIFDVDNVMALWQTFQLHNVVASHSECNMKQPRKTK